MPGDLPKKRRDPQLERHLRRGKIGRKRKVLFVCLGNSCRSQMAEALARHLAADVIEASSAGLIPLGYIAEPTRAALAERAIPCEGQTSKGLREADVTGCDLLVNMSGRELKNLFDHHRPPLEDWDVRDPFGSEVGIHRETLEDIERRVVDLAARLRDQSARQDGGKPQRRAQKRDSPVSGVRWTPPES